MVAEAAASMLAMRLRALLQALLATANLVHTTTSQVPSPGAMWHSLDGLVNERLDGG
jgi:hypothetical protein